MTLIAEDGRLLDDLLEANEGVVDPAVLWPLLSEDQVRWRVSSGRWQRPFRGAIVAHSGPLTETQVARAALLTGGPHAALAGLTAAWMGGFTGFGDSKPVEEKTVYLLLPRGAKRRARPSSQRPASMPFPRVKVRYARELTDDDVFPNLKPRRTRTARSLVDAASWMATDRGAMALLAAGVQQKVTRCGDLRQVLDRMKTVRRRALMYEILGDIEGGAQALSELDFGRKVIKAFGLPEPTRQVGRRDSRGRQRWIDVLFEDWKVIVEIDGAQHDEPLQQWDDMERDNDFTIEGYRPLRFPAWRIRREPEAVARKILAALRAGGYRG
jgi:hypothetical protein